MRQYRSVLGTKSFIRWADEHIVVLIAHNELGHEAEEVETSDGTAKRCPLYPGITCRDHLNIAVDIENSRMEHLPQVPFLELCPNSWLVLPTGEVEQITEKDQFTAKGIKDQVTKAQKKLGAPVSVEDAAALEKILKAGEQRMEEEEWTLALRTFARLTEVVEEPAAGLRGLVSDRLTDIDSEFEYLFEEITYDDDLSVAEKVSAVKALLPLADVDVCGMTLGTVPKMKAWLAENDG